MIRTVADRIASRTRRPTYRGRHRRTRSRPTSASRTPTPEPAEHRPEEELAAAPSA